MAAEKMPEKIDLIAYLSRFGKVLGKYWLLVTVLTALGAGFGCFRARERFVPMYESTAVFSVSSGYAEGDIFTNTTFYDTNAASQLVTAFPSMLGTDIMRDLILAQLDKSWINGVISSYNIPDTNLFELSVRSSSPQDACDILWAVIDCYPQVMVYTLDTPQMIIRQEPYVPQTPYNQFQPLQPTLRGGLLGLAAGLAIVAVLALLSRTVGGPEELKKLINLPLLAAIPYVVVKKRRKLRRAFVSAEDDPGLEESIRGLRTRIHKLLDEKKGKVLLLTSTVPGEGKSTISINLALALAAEGKRVALLDADLRNQSIHKMVGVRTPKGLMDCLKNSELDVLQALRRLPESELCYLSGESTDKRHYHLDDRAIQRVLDALRPRFDYVILDSAPCSVVSDTALLARHADAVLYVVKQDYANQSQILDAVAALHERAIPLGGMVINAVHRSKRTGYGYGYGYSYSSKYGYGRKKS